MPIDLEPPTADGSSDRSNDRWSATREPARIESLDVYRGIVMSMLLFGGLGLADASANLLAMRPENRFWRSINHHFEHAEWVGCTLWDLIEPSFFVLVGVSITLSFNVRFRRHSSAGSILTHVLRRSGVLILLGVAMSLLRQGPGAWGLTNTLTQIGLAYAVVALAWNKSWATKSVIVVLVLAAAWLMYLACPYTGINLVTGDPSVGVSREWAQAHLVGVPAMWHKNANVGHFLDIALLNALPRTEMFTYDREGYQTLIFLPSSALIVIGMLAGDLIRRKSPLRRKIGCLFLASVCGVSLGWVLHSTGLCPLIKKTYTASFVVFSAGICAAVLGTLISIIDVAHIRFWAWPFRVVGRNSIVAYCMALLGFPVLRKSLHQLFGWGGDKLGGDILVADWLLCLLPILEALTAGALLWLLLYQMHRRSIYLRI